MFSLLECIGGYCGYRVTYDTALEFLPVEIKREEIPAEGLFNRSGK